MGDVLVVYFSRSGVTERLARALAAKLGAALDPIRPRVSYAGADGFAKGVWHSLWRRTPEVDYQRDPARYSLVIVGSPVWAGRVSAPVRSYLKQRHVRAGAVAAFWVSGSGQGYPTVSKEIERLVGRALLATASFSEREVGTDAAEAKLEALARALGAPPRKAA